MRQLIARFERGRSSFRALLSVLRVTVYKPEHGNWGLAWQLKERWDRAIEQFQIAISQKSDHAPSHINLGSALAVKERFKEACCALRRGVALDDSCNDAKFNLGLTF